MAGRLVHFEIRAGDRERAKRFWGPLFGWRLNDWEGGAPYTLIEANGEPNGGMYETDSGERGLLVYFDVEDIDGTLERVGELGGEVLEGKSPVPGMGWYARCRDTEGNEFSLFQVDESAPAPS